MIAVIHRLFVLELPSHWDQPTAHIGPPLAIQIIFHWSAPEHFQVVQAGVHPQAYAYPRHRKWFRRQEADIIIYRDDPITPDGISGGVSGGEALKPGIANHRLYPHRAGVHGPGCATDHLGLQLIEAIGLPCCPSPHVIIGVGRSPEVETRTATINQQRHAVALQGNDLTASEDDTETRSIDRDGLVCRCSHDFHRRDRRGNGIDHGRGQWCVDRELFPGDLMPCRRPRRGGLQGVCHVQESLAARYPGLIPQG